MKKISGLLAAAFFSAMVLVGAAYAGSDNFRTHLSGDNEVPAATDTMAQGEAIFRFSKDGTELYYKLIAANIVDILQAHIHLAPADQNGPIVLWLYPDEPPAQLIPGRFDGVLAEGVVTGEDLVGPLTGNTLQELRDSIESGNAYVNVHTNQNPGGEIRGQIR